MENEKYIGNSTIKGEPSKPLKFKLSERIKALFVDLQNQIDSLNNIWAKIEEITGEQLLGITLTTSPNYTVGEWNSTVTIDAHPSTPGEVFDHVAIYNGDELLVEGDNLRSISTSISTQVTANIRCEATILGIPYVSEKVITHFASFWLGAGDTYQDLMDANNRFLPQYAIPITNGMRGAYNVTVEDGKRIIIVVGDTLSEGFIRADLNGVEIQFTESACTDVDGKSYKVFTSEPWTAGEYNIDING